MFTMEESDHLRRMVRVIVWTSLGACLVVGTAAGVVAWRFLGSRAPAVHAVSRKPIGRRPSASAFRPAPPGAEGSSPGFRAG